MFILFIYLFLASRLLSRRSNTCTTLPAVHLFLKFILVSILIFEVLGIKPGGLGMLGKCSIIEINPQP
jgi:hypothetical protein